MRRFAEYAARATSATHAFHGLSIASGLYFFPELNGLSFEPVPPCGQRMLCNGDSWRCALNLMRSSLSWTRI